MKWKMETSRNSNVLILLVTNAGSFLLSPLFIEHGGSMLSKMLYFPAFLVSKGGHFTLSCPVMYDQKSLSGRCNWNVALPLALCLSSSCLDHSWADECGASFLRYWGDKHEKATCWGGKERGFRWVLGGKLGAVSALHCLQASFTPEN